MIISTAIVCITLLIGQLFHYTYLQQQRKHVDSSKLSETLELKLKDLEDLKIRMNQLLLKQGLGR